jgi:hypothetical protein
MTKTVQGLAARLRMTEGQLYSATITLVLAVLLATGLGNVHGVVSSALAQPPLAPLPAAALPPVVVPTPAPAAEAVPLSPPLMQPLAPPPAAAPPVALAEPTPAPSPVPTSSAPSPSPTAQPSPSPSPGCTAQPVADGGAGVVRTLDDAAGGDLPDEDLIAAITLLTGCTPSSPSPTPLPGAAGGLG